MLFRFLFSYFIYHFSHNIKFWVSLTPVPECVVVWAGILLFRPPRADGTGVVIVVVVIVFVPLPNNTTQYNTIQYTIQYTILLDFEIVDASQFRNS